MNGRHHKSDYPFINALRETLGLPQIPYSETLNTRYEQSRKEQNVRLLEWSAEALPSMDSEQ